MAMLSQLRSPGVAGVDAPAFVERVRVLVPVAVDSPRRYTGAMNAIDERACGKPGCDNFGKPGLNIVGHGWFVTKSGPPPAVPLHSMRGNAQHEHGDRVWCD